MIIDFGDYKGMEISSPTIPDHYICFLAKPRYRNSTDHRVPLDVKTAARAEAERRGWSLKGEVWENNNDSSIINVDSSVNRARGKTLEKESSPEEKKSTRKCRNCGRENKIIGDGLDSGCYWAVKGLEKGTHKYETVLAEAKKRFTDPNYKRAPREKKNPPITKDFDDKPPIPPTPSGPDAQKTREKDCQKQEKNMTENMTINPPLPKNFGDPIINAILIERMECLSRADKLGRAIDILLR